MVRSSGAVLPVLGITLAAFGSGFGVCMFNMDTVGECLNVAGGWVGKFEIMGNHVMAWIMTMLNTMKH